MAERAKRRDSNAMDMDTTWSGNRTSWDEAKSIKNKKEDKGKGHDWSKSIQGMSLDEARAWFKDYENLAVKSGKA